LFRLNIKVKSTDGAASHRSELSFKGGGKGKFILILALSLPKGQDLEKSTDGAASHSSGLSLKTGGKGNLF